MADFQQNPFTAEAFSNRLRYEAFSKLATSINSCKTIDEIGESLLRHLKFIITFSGVKFRFSLTDGSCTDIRILQSKVEVEIGRATDMTAPIIQGSRTGIPELFSGKKSETIARKVFGWPLLNSKHSMAVSRMNEMIKGFSIFLTKTEESSYSSVDVKFAILIGEFLLSKTDRIHTADALKMAHSQINEQHEDIIASLNYAKRIQRSIISKEEQLLSPFGGNGFILSGPKDYVTGDFYWSHTEGDQSLVVAADCTGHGVPGALLTVMAVKFLDRICKSENILQPDQILQRLDQLFTHDLNDQVKVENQVKDGLDAAIVLYDKKECILEFSGAKRPLLIYRAESQSIETIRGSILSVGNNYANHLPVFEKHRFALNSGDRIYLGSDGYADQFGGPKNKKFKSGALRNLLETIQTHDMRTQRGILSDTFIQWKGNTPQTDDVLLIGVEI